MCAMVVCFGVTLVQLVPRHPTPGLGRTPIALDWNNRVLLADLPQAPMRHVADLLPWLVPFWVAGVILFYLRHLVSWILTRRLRQTGVCSAPDLWQERLSVLTRRLGLSRPVGLLESCLAGVPVVMGHLRPVILMPVGLLTGLPAGQIESILLHELAHIRRYDYLANMLQTSVEGLLFYHPVVWWMSGVIRAEREHCCDDLAVSLERRRAPIRRGAGRLGTMPVGCVGDRAGRYRRKSRGTNSPSAHSCAEPQFRSDALRFRRNSHDHGCRWPDCVASESSGFAGSSPVTEILRASSGWPSRPGRAVEGLAIYQVAGRRRGLHHHQRRTKSVPPSRNR